MVFAHKRILGPRTRVVALGLILSLMLPFPTVLAKGAKGRDKKQEPEGSRIYGKVRTPDGKSGVPGVTIRAYHLASEASFTSEPTRADGSFELNGLPFGYFDLVAETEEGTFVAEQVVSVPPAGKALVLLSLLRYEDQPESWWATHERRDLPGTGEPADGLAALDRRRRGVEFWKSPKGIVVIAGAGAALMFALVEASDDDDLEASPIVP